MERLNAIARAMEEEFYSLNPTDPVDAADLADNAPLDDSGLTLGITPNISAQDYDPIRDELRGIATDDFIDFADNAGVEEIIQNKVSKPIRDLKHFLSGTGGTTFITEKKDQRTNVINVSEGKTYCLPEPHVEEFFTYLDECRKEKRLLHYSERQETVDLSHSGIMIDFDRYQRSRDPQFTDRHFETLAMRIAKLLREFIDFTDYSVEDRFTFRVFYIRKPAVVLHSQGTGTGGADGATNNGVQGGAVNGNSGGKVNTGSIIYKDGFHVLIPEIQVVKGLKRHLTSELVSRGIIKAIFKDIDHIDDPEKMLDKMSSSVPVHFFGNSKTDRPPYILSHAYEIVMDVSEEDIERRNLDVKKLQEGFAPGRETASPDIPINLTYELSLGFYLKTFKIGPTWLQKRQFNYVSALETKIQLNVEKNTRDLIDPDDLLASENSIDILTLGNAEAKYLKNLLAILDASYATEYEKWFKVICAIAHTNANYKPLAVWFSQRVPDKWSQADCDRVWNEATSSRSNRNPVTKRSIVHWAKESSPQRFREIEKENYAEKLAKYVYQNEGRVEHAMAGNIIHSMLSEKFTVDVGYNEKTGRVGYCWLEFVASGQAMRRGEIWKWRREIEPDNIHLFIAEHLPKVYLEQAQRIRERKDASANENEAKYWSNVEKTFRQYMSRLSNDGFQTGIVRQAQYKFRSRGFLDELDQDEDLIGVGNGVLKIGPEPKLYRGWHEYKVSRFTETDYIDRPYNPYGAYEAKIIQWALDIFPEPDVNFFMWCHAATGLDFCEAACLLLLLVGGGQNGKTSWAKMIHNTLGNQYCAAGKSALLTSHIERGESANSAQMQMRDKRFFYFDEFNKSETINTARLKSIVNPGWQSGRDLREKQTNFRNTANPVALSNYDFMVETTDHGTWRRLYYYRNKAKFSKYPNRENVYEKLADDKWINAYPNDPSFKTAFLSVMVNHYSILCRSYDKDIKNILVPTIQRETEEFRNRQDALNRFITQMIVRSPNYEPMALATLSGRYADWYNRNVKMSSQSVIEIQAAIENSRIASALEYRSTGVKFLCNHRVKNSPEEPLQEGESEIIQIKQTDGGEFGLSVGEDGSLDMENATVRVDGVVKMRPGGTSLRSGVEGHGMRSDAESAKFVQIDQPVKKLEFDGFIRDLIKNSPKYIQNTDVHEDDNIADAVQGMLDGL